MKKITSLLLSIATLFILTVAAPVVQGQQIPSWAQANIDKIAESVPDLTEDQKLQIVEALTTRGEAVKEAEGMKSTGTSDDEIKAATKEAWTAYIHRLKEILSEEQFAKFDAARKKE